MKRTTVCLLISLSALLFICTGCNKEAVDGIYKPEKQIAKIYSTDMFENAGMFENMDVSETWTWNGDLLEKIVYKMSWGMIDDAMDNSTIDFPSISFSSINFYYDVDKLSKITADDGTVFSISYKGSKFDKIDIENKNQYLSGTFNFKHSNSKISEISYNETISAKSSKRSNVSINKMLEFLLPAQTSKILVKNVAYLAQNAIESKADGYKLKVVMKLS